MRLTTLGSWTRSGLATSAALLLIGCTHIGPSTVARERSRKDGKRGRQEGGRANRSAGDLPRNDSEMKVLEPPLPQVDTAVIPGVRGTIDL
jgi:hypothetical protein